MRITFLGGADQVGASSILIEISGKRLLIDAGIHPSPKARRGLTGDQLPHLTSIEALDAILVTHAHTDHTGALELVVAQFPYAPVYATAPTVALTRVLHADARRIMTSRLDEEGELPLYDDVAVQKLLAAMIAVPFRARLPLGEGLAATFYPAGHIAGAAMIALDSDEGRVLISGDVSVSPQRTVDGLKPPPFRPDVLVLESTYGGRLHANRATEERRLVERVAQVTGTGGKVLIPAFALGRAQELIEILRAFRKANELPGIPVWVDGMVRAVCGIYSQFPDALPLALQERDAQFFDEFTRPVERGEQRNALVWESNPAIIISSSGMLAGGPSLSYARALAGQPQHAIFLTGYQDEESPGRRLQEMAARGHGSLKLGKELVQVQCELGTYGLSAHADEAQLVSLTETLDPASVFLVHGDASARESIAHALRERGRRFELPRAGQSFEFRLRPSPTARRARAIGADRPLDLRILWREIADPGGGYFTLTELARAWWGDDARAGELQDAIEKDASFFVAAERGLARARTREQIEHHERRVARVAELHIGDQVHWRDAEGNVRAARITSVERDHFFVDDDETPHYPEEISADSSGSSSPEPASAMEPNAALAAARAQFPPQARLRRAGYRLEQRILVLTFDFPIVARERFKDIVARLESGTGWKIEIDPETNQAALGALLRQTLPEGCEIVKGPSIHREDTRVAVTVRGATGDLESAVERFRETSGYVLSITVADGSGRRSEPGVEELELAGGIAEPKGIAMEINTALGLIRAQLEGSTLYRTSLKGDTIVLSFISPQVGARYREQMDTLSRTVGRPLAIHPQPNQMEILRIAHELIERAGWVLRRPPSIHTDRGEVRVIAGPTPMENPMDVQTDFEARTGYRLVVEAGAGMDRGETPREELAEIPLARIRITRHQQALTLDASKQQKAVEQLRQWGRANKPIRVKRVTDGYILLDGLYRLRAAQILGWERIAATVEE